MFNLYSHIEALAQEHGYQNVQELCKEAGIYPSVLSNLNKRHRLERIELYQSTTGYSL